MFPQTALLVDRAVPCSMLKYGGNAALFSSLPPNCLPEVRGSSEDWSDQFRLELQANVGACNRFVDIAAASQNVCEVFFGDRFDVGVITEIGYRLVRLFERARRFRRGRAAGLSRR